MIFYFNADGSLINYVPSKVYQGSNKASRIYFVCPTARTNVVSVAFTLPNGEYTAKYLMTLSENELSSGNGEVVNENGETFSVWEYDIPQALTSFAGRCAAQFFIDNGTTDDTTETVATQSVLFLIETGAGYIDPNLTVDDFQQIANYLVNLQQQIQASVNIEVVQTTGDSASAVMSQNAVTSALNGKQPILTFDDTPTQNSANPVKSNGIFESIQDVMNVANGKTQTYILSYNDTFSNGVAGATWKDIDGNTIIPNSGNYIDSNCINNVFNSQNVDIVLPTGSKYVIFREHTKETMQQINYIVVNSGLFANKFNRGENIYIIETDVPDRWYAGGVRFYALEGNLSSKSAVTVNGQIVQTFNADTKANVPTSESFTISSWTELADSSPFTHSAIVTASTTIGANATVELINNQAVLFGNYGFAIASISGQNITIYSIGQLTESVTLKLEVTNQ